MTPFLAIGAALSGGKISVLSGNGLFSPIVAMGSPAGGGDVNPLVTFGPILLMVVIFYLIAIRPQQKKQKDHQKMLTELKKGDRVVTTGGMFGEVFAFNEERNSLTIKSGEVKLEFLKSSIAGKSGEEKAS